MMQAVDLAVCTIFSKGCQDFGLGVCNLPAWPLRVQISRTFRVNVLRAVQYLPAGFFVFKEICHFGL
jgi:hypothetical protein